MGTSPRTWPTCTAGWISKTSISTITETVLDRMAEWQNRPLNPAYPLLWAGAVVKAPGTGFRCGLG
ncbi:transposase [Arthrobacter wenxiniae]|uniref:Mutator family transposase n=1 Tax=Arthrobacter wenxiniae TaxID=2713570 RepID=A0A7Y7LXQ4_9MICC|nr:hypothetical protein [Arthrobacter wenxiniae]